MAGHAENKVKQIDREIKAHQHEITRLKARRKAYSDLIDQTPAEATQEASSGPEQPSTGVSG